jgi:hypothetical protein
MIRRPPRSTQPTTLFPYTTLFRSVVAGVLVIVTGGLEAGIAMHILNNFAALGMAVFFGDVTEALTGTEGDWWMIPVTLTQSLVFLGLVWLAARWRGVATHTVLEPLPPRL